MIRQIKKLKTLLSVFLVIVLSLTNYNCSSDNLAKGRAPEQPDDTARRHLNNGDYDAAITELEKLIASDPENYKRYALLGAAYAAKAGVSILDMVKAQFSGSSSSNGSAGLVSQVSQFLPSNPTDAQLEALNGGISKLQSIPESLRAETTEEAYGRSASFQLSLYAAAYSVMYMSQFAAPETGNFTPESLSTLTDEDVDNIIEALQISAASGTGPAAGMGEAVNEALATISQEPGATTREKLQNYLARTGQQPTQ